MTLSLLSTSLKTFDFRQEPESLDDNILFSRETEASYMGADGYIRFAQPGQNLLTQSQDFENEVWAKVGVKASVPSELAAPDGKNTVCKLTEANVLGEHRMSRNVNVIKGQPVTLSVYVKAGTRSKIQFSFVGGASFTGGTPAVRFDLTDGSFLSYSSNVIGHQAISAGNGWWRLKITGLPDRSPESGLHIFILSDNKEIHYSGNSDNYIYVWGAQLEQGTSLSVYAPTSDKPYSGLRYNYRWSGEAPALAGALIEPAGTNLIRYSQLFTNSAWVKQSADVAATRTLSPDGQNFAFKIRENIETTTHYIQSGTPVTTERNKVYTLSAYFKAAERKWACVTVNDSAVHLDLESGTFGNRNSTIFPTVAVETIGKGWSRFSITFPATSGSATIGIGPGRSNGQASYAGDGESGILVWGVQFEKSEEVTSYIRTTSAAVERAADLVILKEPFADEEHDIFIQRTRGGVWLSKMKGDYQISPSESEMQAVNYYDADEPDSNKEDIAQSLFPHKYEGSLINNALLKVLDATFMVQSPNKSWSLRQAQNKTSPVFRFQVRSGDTWTGDARNPKRKERCEMYMKNTPLPFDRDVWFSYAIRIAAGDPLDLSAVEWCYLGQVHATEDSGEMSTGPVLGFRLEGLDTVSAYTASTLEDPIQTAPKYIYRGGGRFTRGVWHRVVVRMRFSPTNAQLQWWQNGKELINISDIGMGYPDKLGPYWKFGIYRSAMRPTLTVEYANMEVAYGSSLKHRIAEPAVII
jgi:hypothetical protein